MLFLLRGYCGDGDSLLLELGGGEAEAVVPISPSRLRLGTGVEQQC